MCKHWHNTRAQNSTPCCLHVKTISHLLNSLIYANSFVLFNFVASFSSFCRLLSIPPTPILVKTALASTAHLTHSLPPPQDHFPEVSASVTVVRAPWSVVKLYELLKPWLSQHVQQKVPGRHITRRSKEPPRPTPHATWRLLVATPPSLCRRVSAGLSEKDS